MEGYIARFKAALAAMPKANQPQPPAPADKPPPQKQKSAAPAPLPPPAPLVPPAPLGSEVAMIASSYAPSEVDRQAEYRKHLERAMEMRRSGNHHGAISELQAAILLIPTAELLRAIGEEMAAWCPRYAGDGDYAARADCYERAINYYRRYLKARPLAVDVIAIEERIEKLDGDKKYMQRRARAAAARSSEVAERDQNQRMALLWGIATASLGAIALAVGFGALYVGVRAGDELNVKFKLLTDGERQSGFNFIHTADILGGVSVAASFVLFTTSAVLLSRFVKLRAGQHLTFWISPTANGFLAGGTF